MGPNYFWPTPKNQSLSTMALWGVYPEVLRTLSQKSHFFLPCFIHLAEKSHLASICSNLKVGLLWALLCGANNRLSCSFRRKWPKAIPVTINIEMAEQLYPFLCKICLPVDAFQSYQPNFISTQAVSEVISLLTFRVSIIRDREAGVSGRFTTESRMPAK